MNRIDVIIYLGMIGMIALEIWGLLNADILFLATGWILGALLVVLLVKRDRLSYWGSMATGKPHIEKWIGASGSTYDEMNKEHDRRLGKAMEKSSMLLAYGAMLGGAVVSSIPGLGPIIGIISVSIGLSGAVSLWALKWLFGYREYRLNSNKRHMVNYWMDSEGNEGTHFYERYKVSRRLTVRESEWTAAIDLVEMKARAEYESRVQSGKMAQEAVDDEIAKLLKDVKAAIDAYETEVVEDIKASELIKKYVKVGIDQPVDAEAEEDKTSEEKEEKKIYEPDVRMLYPAGDPKRRCVLVTPANFSVAMGVGKNHPLRFRFWRFEAPADIVGTIRLGSLHDILLNGESMDGVKVELPEGIDALDTKIPVFVLTDSQWTDAQRLQGMQMVRPPRILRWVIRMIKALLAKEKVGKKFEDKDTDIEVLQESNDRLRFKLREKDVRRRMEEPGAFPLHPPDSRPDEAPEPEKLKRKQAILVLIVGLCIGAVAMFYALPLIGWRLLPPGFGG
jgi:hypothetical protein